MTHFHQHWRARFLASATMCIGVEAWRAADPIASRSSGLTLGSRPALTQGDFGGSPPPRGQWCAPASRHRIGRDAEIGEQPPAWPVAELLAAAATVRILSRRSSRKRLRAGWVMSPFLSLLSIWSLDNCVDGGCCRPRPPRLPVRSSSLQSLVVLGGRRVPAVHESKEMDLIDVSDHSGLAARRPA
jgi:hypothetical protein